MNKFAKIREVNGNQVLFYKSKDDEGNPSIKNVFRINGATVTLDATMPSKEIQDRDFDNIDDRSDGLIQELIDSVQKMF